jgi:hypothetical protein
MRLATSLMLVVLAVACEQWEVLEETYSSRDQLVRDGAITRGWIPEWIPASATDVREVHDLDTNRSQLAFAYREFDTAALAPSCKSETQSRITVARTALRSWWPPELTVASAETKRFSLFACAQDREPQAFLAIDPANRTAYFWREWSG